MDEAQAVTISSHFHISKTQNTIRVPTSPFHSPRARLRTIASLRRSPISRLRVLVHIIGTAPLKYAANEPAPLPVEQKHYISIRAFTAMLCASIMCHVTIIAWFPRRVLASLQAATEYHVIMRRAFEAKRSILGVDGKRN